MDNDNALLPLRDRRSFIASGMKAALATAAISSPLFSGATRQPADYTVQKVIDIILREIPGAPFPQTVDTIKSGSADMIVSGIVTTMFATVEVITEAAKRNANFIIAHEPTFYNHTDDLNWVPGNTIVKHKQELLQKNNITVWRFHDYWHSHKPDGIGYGVLQKTGWLSYYKPGELILEIPEATLKDVVEHLKDSLGIPHVRVVGDMAASCRRIALIPGAAGGQMQMSAVERYKPDVLVVGEVHEWETAEYIRDGRLLGSSTSLVVLGHCVSEEPGMAYLVEWLKPRIPGVPVTHIPSGSPFIWA